LNEVQIATRKLSVSCAFSVPLNRINVCFYGTYEEHTQPYENDFGKK
jgi:hypothetical protein